MQALERSGDDYDDDNNDDGDDDDTDDYYYLPLLLLWHHAAAARTTAMNVRVSNFPNARIITAASTVLKQHVLVTRHKGDHSRHHD